MAWASGGDLVGPPAYKLGIDVMKVQLPKRECFANFLDAFGDQVSQSALPGDSSTDRIPPCSSHLWNTGPSSRHLLSRPSPRPKLCTASI